MKIYKYSDNTGSLKSLIFQLQLTIEFSQIKDILFVYRDLLVLITNYSFLFEDSSSEIPALKENPVYVETAFFTQDPARDGVNLWIYCNGNPITFVDPDGNFILNTNIWYNKKYMQDFNASWPNSNESIAKTGCTAVASLRGCNTIVNKYGFVYRKN